MKLMKPTLLLGLSLLTASSAFANENPADPPTEPIARSAGIKAACTDPAPVCDGIADDTCELNELLSHTNPEMTVVEIPATPAGCHISEPLYVGSNTHVIQNGLLRYHQPAIWPPLGSSAQMTGMYTILNNAHDVIIEGSGVLDGGIANFMVPTSCCMGGITSGGGNLNHYDTTIRDVTIRGLTLRNIQTWPIGLDGATNLRIDGIVAHDAPYSSSVGHGSRNVIVTNSHFYRNNDTCFAFYRGVEDAIIANSIANQCQGATLTVFSDWLPPSVGTFPDPQYSKNVIFNNNLASGQNNKDFGSSGMTAQGYNSAGDMTESVSFTFNLAHSSHKEGIGLSPTRHALLAGNMTHSHGAPSLGGPLLWPEGIGIRGAKGVLVSGNSSFNEGYADSKGFGVYIDGSCLLDAARPDFCVSDPPGVPRVDAERISVMDNYFYDSNAVQTMLNAIKSVIPGPVVIAGNTYAPLLGSAYDSGYTNPDSVVTDNDAQP